VLEALELESNGKEIHLEILSKVCALGFVVKEIPAILSSRKGGKSKFKFRRTAGLFFILSGFLIGCYIVWLRYFGTLNPSRPLVPLMIILLLLGSQFFCFAFIAMQNNHLRNEVYRLQKQINFLKSKKD
jgi:hypothetical protein